MNKQIVRGTIILDDSSIVQQQYATSFNNLVLVIDTETHTDISQYARILTYTVFDIRKNTSPDTIQYEERGMVCYDLQASEKIALKAYCSEHNLLAMGKDTFIKQRLFPLVAQGTLLVGHNLPFDLGAIATDFSVVYNDNAFRLKLCTCNETSDSTHSHLGITHSCMLHPTLYIKQLKPRKYLMYFERANYGAVIDTIVTGNAFLGAGASSLNAMVARYGMHDEKKLPMHNYGEVYTKDMFEYAMQDIYLTSKLLIAEYQLYLKHGLDKPFYLFMSEASVGKAYEEKLGVPPFRQAHSEIKQALYTIANTAYYGARSEANYKGLPVLIRYCDFKSQYPMVNALLDTQRYLLADYIQVVRNADEIQELLDKITLPDLQDKVLWKELITLVKVYTDGDIFPHKFESKTGVIYGQQVLKNTISWYTLADCIASKIRTGKAPHVLDAYHLIPHGAIQTKEVDIFCNPQYHVNLDTDDFFATVIDLRDSVKQEIKQIEQEVNAPALSPATQQTLNERKVFLDNLQLALKLMANSSSYGILVETREVNRRDVAGKYNAQPIGVHITACGRLLLAIAEMLGIERGISYALCDTDSFAYAKPDTMDTDTFYTRVQECTSWFNVLSPFRGEGDIFELEKYNFLDKKDTPLYALCISAKRYALFNITSDGKPIIRKLSEHGLPAFLYDRGIPLPDDVLLPHDSTWKIDRYLMWYRGIETALHHTIMQLPIEEWSKQPTYKQVSITCAHVYSNNRAIAAIRPFSFFCISPASRKKERKQRYYFPYCNTIADLHHLIDDNKVRLVETNEVALAPIFDTLHERFYDFFYHVERKASNGSEHGYMQRFTIDGSDTVVRLRSGKKVNDMQLRLFE